MNQCELPILQDPGNYIQQYIDDFDNS
ncbi:TPA: hypothetical protein ACMDNS_001973 [Vibrio cholerae]